MRDSQRGSIIVYLFICVALFGMLIYAFNRGTRTSLSWIEGEKDKADVTRSTECANNLNLAQKRLELRGCAGMISVSSDGVNTNPDAPTDGSCSIYHPNGGGLRPCDGVVVASDPCASSPARGDRCADGSFYLGNGTTGGLPAGDYYAWPMDEAITYAWKTSNTATAGTGSMTNGTANTASMAAAGLPLHPAAGACQAHGPEWFVPALNELQIV